MQEAIASKKIEIRVGTRVRTSLKNIPNRLGIMIHDKKRNKIILIESGLQAWITLISRD